MVPEDTYWHKGLRKKLIDELAKSGINDSKVLEVMMQVPRHWFLDSALAVHAYENKALLIDCEQTISHPSTVAFQTQLLNISKEDKILEIGTGSGYQAIILATYKAFVYTIERQKVLFDKFQKNEILKKYYNLKCFYGDGYKGLETFAPFNKIIITAAAPEIPKALLDQLTIGGIMVIPLNSSNNTIQEMKKITKLSNINFKVETFSNFSFVPMLEGKVK